MTDMTASELQGLIYRANTISNAQMRKQVLPALQRLTKEAMAREKAGRELNGKPVDLDQELVRLRSHSVMLNRTAWRIAEAMGDVQPGDDGKHVDLAALIDKACTRLQMPEVGLSERFKMIEMESNLAEARTLVSRSINVLLQVKIALDEGDVDEAVRIISEATEGAELQVAPDAAVAGQES